MNIEIYRKELVKLIPILREELGQAKYPLLLQQDLVKLPNSIVIKCGKDFLKSFDMAQKIRVHKQFINFLDKNEAVCGLMKHTNAKKKEMFQLEIRF